VRHQASERGEHVRLVWNKRREQVRRGHQQQVGEADEGQQVGGPEAAANQAEAQAKQTQ
jgi:hypothetical protein